MIRASRSISLNANQINFNNSFALAPIIDLNGIVLRADRPLTEQLLIKNFLIQHNAQISRVRINYRVKSSSAVDHEHEYYIRIYVTFSIFQKDTKKFLDLHSDFMENQLEGIDKIIKATQMHSCITEQYNLCQKDVTYANLLQNTIWEVPSAGYFGGESTNIQSVSIHSSQPTLGGNLLNIRTNELISEGKIFYHSTGKQKTNAGLMTPFFSLKSTNIQISSYANLKDAFIQGEAVNISVTSSKSSDNNDKNLNLYLSPEIDWLNNPYHEFHTMFIVKSGVEMYEFKKERGEDSKQRVTVIKAIPRPK